MSAITKIFFVLTFVFGTAIGYTYTRIKDLSVNGTYEGSNCDADVTCTVFSTNSSVFLSWTCTGIGCPSGIFDKNNIPGFRVLEMKTIGFWEYQQTISIKRCYSPLTLTCSIGFSSRTLTIRSGYSYVKDLSVYGTYEGSNCDADVTCTVSSTDSSAFISWKCIECPSGISDINNISGFRVGEMKTIGSWEYKQTISIKRCYSQLKLTCSIGFSSRTVKLRSGRNLGGSNSSTGGRVPVYAIVLIIIVGLLFKVGIARGIILLRMKIKDAFIPYNNLAPPLCSQPAPMVYPGNFQPPPQQPPPCQ